MPMQVSSHALKPHPDAPSAAATSLEVEVSRPSPRTLALRYTLAGRTADLAIPAPAAPARKDELWRHTCFEAFFGPEGAEAYCEFNLAPSTEWAAYQFDGYRAGMRSPEAVPAPHITVHAAPDRLVLQAELDLSAFTDLPADAPWRLALSAVIEDARGNVSYWALAHPEGRADFHHPDCFATRVLAPDRP